MIRSLLIVVLSLITGVISGIGNSDRDTIIYLFPGQGADQRLFKNLEVPSAYNTVHISFPIPQRICTELCDTLAPEKTIVISSAKSKSELPGRYTFQQKLRFNRIVPKHLTKGGARILQGIVEPDRKK